MGNTQPSGPAIAYDTEAWKVLIREAGKRCEEANAAIDVANKDGCEVRLAAAYKEHERAYDEFNEICRADCHARLQGQSEAQWMTEQFVSIATQSMSTVPPTPFDAITWDRILADAHASEREAYELLQEATTEDDVSFAEDLLNSRYTRLDALLRADTHTPNRKGRQRGIAEFLTPRQISSSTSEGK